MAASQSPAASTSASPIPVPHIHVVQEACPVCDQLIPNDRLDEINERIQTRERDRTSAITERLTTQFAREQAEAMQLVRKDANAALEKERAQAGVREASAREEARQAAEIAGQQKLDAALASSQQTQAALTARIEQSEAAKQAAEQTGITLKAQLEQARRDSDAAIQQVRQDAIANESVIRSEAQKAAEAGIQEKIATLQKAHGESQQSLQARINQAEADKANAVESGNALKAQLDQVRRDGETAIENLKQESSARENAVREETKTAVVAEMQTKIAAEAAAKTGAEIRAAAAEQKLLTVNEAHEVLLGQRLKEQRDALEQAKTEAVNAEKSAAFEEKAKLSSKVEDLQRALDKKTAEDLGEGAEIDLFEMLKQEFQNDRIERINKGQQGADILHTVMHNGKECGRIIYDSKNHNAWRHEFVTKLSADQMAAKAEHAILSTRKFPAGARQLEVQDGVMLASPSRVQALVRIVREHMVRTHALRFSNEAKTQKTAELYAFITSERCATFFQRIDNHTESLLEMQVREKKAHDKMWKDQGEAIRGVQKVQAELCNEIDMIIGTADVGGPTS